VINDVRTIAWKELREILSRGETTRRRRSLLGTVVFPILLGAFLGFQSGLARDAVGRGIAVFPVGLLAMGTTTGLITDAVAGERERHTLETLLASPASDSGILTGKLTAVIGYAWALALLQLAVIGIASSLAGRGTPVAVLVVVALLSLLEATLSAGFGVQFSLRAPSVRAAARKQAQYAIFVNLLASGVNVLAATPVSGPGRPLAVAAAFVVLAGADAGLLGLARVRFQRGRLLLD
jgi:ABC-2 type transport system permease protein